MCVFFAGALLLVLYYWLIPAVRYAINSSKPPQTVSVDQLRQEIRENLKGAQSKYPPGTPLIVTGVVVGVENWAVGSRSPLDLVLSGTDKKAGEFPWITCGLSGQNTVSVGPSNIEDFVTVQGFCFLVREEGLWLRNCTVLEVNERQKAE
jgi:hypothetical protein